MDLRVETIVKIILSEKPIIMVRAHLMNMVYANVNPLVDHPRWSQKKERRIEN